MAIFRIHSNRNYEALSIHHLRDTTLSWQAMGMLSFMLSCKEDFKFSIEGLTECSTSGNSATRSALKELKEHGYVCVSRITNEQGKVLEWQYDIFEQPNADDTHVENPHVEEPHVENPHVENQRQSNTNKSNTNKSIIPPLSPLGGKTKPDLSFVSPDFIPAMTLWLDYKKEKGQSYKPIGLKGCYQKLLELSSNNPDNAMAIVKQSIANNYAGLFPLKIKNEYGRNNSYNATETMAYIAAGINSAITEMQFADNRQ